MAPAVSAATSKAEGSGAVSGHFGALIAQSALPPNQVPEPWVIIDFPLESSQTTINITCPVTSVQLNQ